MVASDIGCPVIFPGKTSDPPSPRVSASRRMEIARSDSGTLCAFFAFIRDAGMIHSARAKLISSHVPFDFP